MPIQMHFDILLSQVFSMLLFFFLLSYLFNKRSHNDISRDLLLPVPSEQAGILQVKVYVCASESQAVGARSCVGGSFAYQCVTVRRLVA